MYKQKWVQCVSVTDRVQAGPWLGSIREGADIRSYGEKCSTYPSINVATHDANSSFDRISREYVTFFGAVSAYGTELTAQSGASTYVEAHREFGPSQTAAHALCGNDDAPLYPKRIFAGK